MTVRRCAILCVTLALVLLGAGGAVSSATEPSDFTCGVVSEIPQVECEALVALYNSTDGPNWISNSGWLVTDTPCSWYGVACDAPGMSRTSTYTAIN